MIPEARLDQTTPTNETIDIDKKATIIINSEKHTFEISSDDSSVIDVFEDVEIPDRRQSMFKPVGYGRQVSESSEYTTDTHDTGELAQMTALNTIRNTSDIFTSVGDELKKVNLSPSSQSNFSSTATAFIPVTPGGTIDMEATISSTSSRPLPRVSSDCQTSDAQGR